tara:strand:+ start:292 stop:1530 length:1239 start_codon:yes stop_codon:yes gene_type:complete
MGKNAKKQKNRTTQINNHKHFKKYDLNKKDVRLITSVTDTINNSEIKIIISILGPEKHFMVPLMIEIENYRLGIKENHRFDVDTYGLPHHSLYNFNFEKVIYYPYSRIIDGKHTETYNINLFISTRYKTSGINPIYMHQVDKDINPIRGWILKFEEPPKNGKYHILHSFKKDIYSNDNEDRNLNPYDKEKAIEDIVGVKKRYADKLIKCLDKKEGEFKSLEVESGRKYTQVPEDEFEDLSLLHKISLISGNKIKNEKKDAKIDEKKDKNKNEKKDKNKDAGKDKNKDKQTNTLMKENIKGHTKGHHKTLKCKITSMIDNEDIDVFDLSSIEEGNEDEQLEKLADQIYKCVSKKKPIILENNISDRLVEKSSKTEPNYQVSTGLDLEKAIERLKQPIPKEYLMTLPRLPELKI